MNLRGTDICAGPTAYDLYQILFLALYIQETVGPITQNM